MRLKTIIALFFVAIIVIFSIQNAEVTDVKFLIWKISMSRVLVILGSFAVGLAVGNSCINEQKIITVKRLIYGKNHFCRITRSTR